MARVKEIEDKKKAPKLNKAVSKRFVRSALWKAAQSKTEKGAETLVFEQYKFQSSFFFFFKGSYSF